jgi:hypothetical protein
LVTACSARVTSPVPYDIAIACALIQPANIAETMLKHTCQRPQITYKLKQVWGVSSGLSLNGVFDYTINHTEHELLPSTSYLAISNRDLSLGFPSMHRPADTASNLAGFVLSIFFIPVQSGDSPTDTSLASTSLVPRSSICHMAQFEDELYWYFTYSRTIIIHP